MALPELASRLSSRLLSVKLQLIAESQSPRTHHFAWVSPKGEIIYLNPDFDVAEDTHLSLLVDHYDKFGINHEIIEQYSQYRGEVRGYTPFSASESADIDRLEDLMFKIAYHNGWVRVGAGYKPQGIKMTNSQRDAIYEIVGGDYNDIYLDRPVR